MLDNPSLEAVLFSYIRAHELKWNKTMTIDYTSCVWVLGNCVVNKYSKDTVEDLERIEANDKIFFNTKIIAFINICK